MENEIWKDVPGLEEEYQVSNLGRVRSKSRNTWNGHVFFELKSKIKSQRFFKDGYLYTDLYKSMKKKSYAVHVLVAMAFLGHKPDGFKLVVDHIDNNKTNNNASNLRIVTNRENANFKHLNTTSKYVGVYWNKKAKRWRADIRINGEKKYLGHFLTEYDAHLAYQKELTEINKSI